MKPDDIQITGDHYKVKQQHWNMLAEIGFGWEYYIGNATKYLTRAHKKGGLADLLKAEHYTVKLCDLVNAGTLPVEFETTCSKRYMIDAKTKYGTGVDIEAMMPGYCEANGMGSPMESSASAALVTLIIARTLTDLQMALEFIRTAIAETRTSEDTIAEMKGFGTIKTGGFGGADPSSAYIDQARDTGPAVSVSGEVPVMTTGDWPSAEQAASEAVAYAASEAPPAQAKPHQRKQNPAS